MNDKKNKNTSINQVTDKIYNAKLGNIYNKSKESKNKQLKVLIASGIIMGITIIGGSVAIDQAIKVNQKSIVKTAAKKSSQNGLDSVKKSIKPNT